MALSGCGETSQNEGNSENSTSKELATSAPSSAVGFSQIPAASSNLNFQNKIVETAKNNYYTYQYIYNGGGVAVGDLDNDGLQDLYFTGNFGGNKLYKNKGDFQFEDVTTGSGAEGSKWSSGVTLVDINADGLLDIYVCRSGKHSATDTKNLLFINQGEMKFEERAAEYGLDDSGYSTQAAFFDFDLDGDLDMYLMNHPIQFKVPLSERRRLETDPGPRITDRFYINENGTFIDKGKELGIQNYGQGLGLSVADVNLDGYVDVYVANDYAAPDFLYINQKGKKFKESIQEYTRHIPMFAMGCDIADINNDGYDDICVAEMLSADYKRSKVNMASMDPEQFNARVQMGWHHQYMRNTLQINNGMGSFSDIAQMAGVDKTDWSWAVLLADFDNDSWRDLFVTNGFKRDVLDKDFIQKTNVLSQQTQGKLTFDQVYNMLNSTKLRNYVFKNKNGYEFEDKSDSWGLQNKTFSNGAAYGDLDNDGDLDLVVNNINEEVGLYKNNTTGKSLRLKLKGPKENKGSYGAIATLYKNTNSKGNEIVARAHLQPTRGYQSSVEPIIHFGLGDLNLDELKLEVSWPGINTSFVSNKIETGVSEISYLEAKSPTVQYKSKQSSNIVFKERKKSIFTHKEVPVDDFKREILLPHKLSQMGPFAEVGDLNGDGLDDFWVGGARDQAGAIFLQDQSGNFKKVNNPVLEKHKWFEDMGAALFDLDGDKDLDLYVASGGNEAEPNHSSYQDRLYINDGSGTFSEKELPLITISTSCVVADDIDGDGDTDLFVGGRLVPGLYPNPASSFILLNMEGELRDIDPGGKSDLTKIGMVTCARFVDLNGDRYKDLVVGGEWMPLRFLTFQKGILKDETEKYAQQPQTGWWNTLVSADINGDNIDELFAGNLGTNYKYQASPEKPFHIYAGDFDNSGKQDIVLAMESEQGQVPVRGLQCTSEQMPAIKSKFLSYDSFANASIVDLLGSKEIEKGIHYSATNFSSSIFQRNGSQFTAVDLPIEAQLSTVNGIVVEDFDGDGVKDMVVAGNMYHSEVETSRADASVGYFFKGEQDGNRFRFVAVPPFESKLHVPGDVKDVKLIKKTASGQAILLVTNNDGPIQLFDCIKKTNNTRPKGKLQLGSR